MKRILAVILFVVMLMTTAFAAEVEIKSDKGIGKILSTKLDEDTVQIDVTICLLNEKVPVEYEYVTVAMYGKNKPSFPYGERLINGYTYYSYYMDQVRTGKDGYVDCSFTVAISDDETCYLYFSGKNVTEVFELEVLLPPPDPQIVTPMPKPESSGGGGSGRGSSSGFVQVIKPIEDNKTEIIEDEKNNGNIEFSDIDSSHWAYNDCIKLLNIGIISGYDDGTLRPSNYVTREEIAAVLTRAFDIKLQKLDFKMDNTSSEWAREYIAAAVESGIMLKNDNGTYRGRANATRAETVTMINRCLNLEADNDVIAGFDDSYEIPDYSIPSFSALIEKGIINGYTDGTLKPNNNISRAELFKIISRILEEDLI